MTHPNVPPDRQRLTVILAVGGAISIFLLSLLAWHNFEAASLWEQRYDNLAGHLDTTLERNNDLADAYDELEAHAIGVEEILDRFETDLVSSEQDVRDLEDHVAELANAKARLEDDQAFVSVFTDDAQAAFDMLVDQFDLCIDQQTEFINTVLEDDFDDSNANLGGRDVLYEDAVQVDLTCLSASRQLRDVRDYVEALS